MSAHKTKGGVKIQSKLFREWLELDTDHLVVGFDSDQDTEGAGFLLRWRFEESATTTTVVTSTGYPPEPGTVSSEQLMVAIKYLSDDSRWFWKRFGRCFHRDDSLWSSRACESPLGKTSQSFPVWTLALPKWRPNWARNNWSRSSRIRSRKHRRYRARVESRQFRAARRLWGRVHGQQRNGLQQHKLAASNSSIYGQNPSAHGPWRTWSNKSWIHFHSLQFLKVQKNCVNYFKINLILVVVSKYYSR